VARVLPFHRVFHSVELSLLVLAAAVIDVAVDSTVATRALLLTLVVAVAVTVVGHLFAILSSARLR
jgi:hypothetical protein